MKHHSSRSLWIAFKVSLVAFTIATLGTSQVHADEKVYPGSLCVRYAGSQAVNYYWSAIGNRSSDTWLYLDCPVVRDTIGIGVGGSIYRGKVRVNDRNLDYGIECTLVAAWRHVSGLNWWTWTNGTGAAEAGVRVIPYGTINTSSSDVYYYYSCRIPPTYNGAISEIVSYSVEEKS